MEERIIDDKAGRKVRLKKTADGYVDVTDELVDGEFDEEAEDVVTFEYPMLDSDEDDEDLAGLTPEQAMHRIQQKEAEAKARKEEYEKLCAEGDKLLATGSFKAAELKFERAMSMDDKATDATVGYWRAKTADFEEAEALIDEYAEEGVENLEFDLGYEAVGKIKEQFKDKFSARYQTVCKEEEELSQKVTEGQERRRGILKTRRKVTAICFAVSCVIALAMLGLSIYFGLQNFRVRDDRFMVPTIVCVCVFLVVFIAFGVCTNKFINACRIYKANETLSSTEEGARVELLRAQRELYEYLLA